VAASSSRLAAGGALLANPGALARLREADVVLFDKTGTLTRPGVAIETVLPLHTLPAAQCLALAAALERDSAHPIARAFAGVAAARAEGIIHEPARGVSGMVDETRYWLGAPEFAPVPLGEVARGDPALSWIVLTDSQRPLALIGLSAPMRPEAFEVVRALGARGCAVELLSGDAPEPAAALARRLGIACWRARQSATDKLARLRELQGEGRVVVAVGDGINDAPFLAGADVAVALPHGAALAQARADVILLGDRLDPLPQLLDVARRAMRIARQNLAWAAAYNLAVLPLAMAGALAPWMAALGMATSSLLVVANALRLGVAPALPASPVVATA
jgi:Cu2+-exporting ATPase